MSAVAVNSNLVPLYQAVLRGQPVADTLLLALQQSKADAVPGILFAKPGTPLTDDDMAKLLPAIQTLLPGQQEETLAGMLVSLGSAAEALLTGKSSLAGDSPSALIQAACADSADGTAVRAALTADKRYRDAHAEADTFGVLGGICALRAECSTLTDLLHDLVHMLNTEASPSKWCDDAEALLQRAKQLLPAQASKRGKGRRTSGVNPNAEQIAAAAELLAAETADGPAAQRVQHLREVIGAVGTVLEQCQSQPLRYPASKRMLHDVLHAACQVCRDVIGALSKSLETMTTAYKAHVEKQLEHQQRLLSWKATALPLAEKTAELHAELVGMPGELQELRSAVEHAKQAFDELLQRREIVELQTLQDQLNATKEHNDTLFCHMRAHRNSAKMAKPVVKRLRAAFEQAVAEEYRSDDTSALSDAWLEQLRGLCAQVPDRMPEVCTASNLPAIIAKFSATDLSNTVGWSVALACTAAKAKALSALCKQIYDMTGIKEEPQPGTEPAAQQTDLPLPLGWLNETSALLGCIDTDLKLTAACTRAVQDEPSCTTTLLLAFNGMLDTRMFKPGLQRFTQVERRDLKQLVEACMAHISKLNCPLQLLVLSSAVVAYTMLGYEDEGHPDVLLSKLSRSKQAAAHMLVGAATDRLFMPHESSSLHDIQCDYTSLKVSMLQNAPAAAVTGDQLEKLASEALILKKCKREWLLSHLRPLRTDLGPHVLKYPGVCRANGDWLLMTRQQAEPSSGVPRSLLALTAAPCPEARQEVATSLVETYTSLRAAWDSLGNTAQRREVAHCLGLLLLSPAEFAVVQARKGPEDQPLRHVALMTTTGCRIRTTAAEEAECEVFKEVGGPPSAGETPRARSFLHPAISSSGVTWQTIQPAPSRCSYLARTGYAIGATVLQLLGVDVGAVQRDMEAWAAEDGSGAALNESSLKAEIAAAGIDPAHSALVDAARSWLLTTKGEAAADVELDSEPERRQDDSGSVISSESFCWTQADTVESGPVG